MNKTRLLTMTATALLGLWLAADASAGKLADGYRGRAYGPVYALAEAPSDGCQASADPDVLWTCSDSIGGVDVLVLYGGDAVSYYSVSVSAQGYAGCSTLLDVLSAAYGKGMPKQYASGPLKDRTWRDGKVFGVWSYNQFSGSCSMMALHLGLYREHDRRVKASAAAAAGAL